MQSLSDYVISSHKINKDLFSLFDVKSFKSRCSVVANMKDSFVIIEPFDNKPKSKLKRSYYKITNTSNNLDFLNSKGWSQFTSGFIVGGFGGASVAYALLKFINLDSFTI